jgi:hypothetical protein
MKKHSRSSFVAAGLVGALALGFAGAGHAGVTFCNHWKHTVYFAVGYESSEGYTTQGWMPVDPNACRPFTAMPKVGAFYWRGESDWYPIGNGKSDWKPFAFDDATLAVGAYPFGSFKIHGAERGEEGRMEHMSRAPFESPDGDVNVTVTVEDVDVYRYQRNTPGETAGIDTSDPFGFWDNVQKFGGAK